jgi:hypothetical protein
VDRAEAPHQVVVPVVVVVAVGRGRVTWRAGGGGVGGIVTLTVVAEPPSIDIVVA